MKRKELDTQEENKRPLRSACALEASFPPGQETRASSVPLTPPLNKRKVFYGFHFQGEFYAISCENHCFLEALYEQYLADGPMEVAYETNLTYQTLSSLDSCMVIDIDPASTYVFPSKDNVDGKEHYSPWVWEKRTVEAPDLFLALLKARRYPAGKEWFRKNMLQQSIDFRTWKTVLDWLGSHSNIIDRLTKVGQFWKKSMSMDLDRLHPFSCFTFSLCFFATTPLWTMNMPQFPQDRDWPTFCSILSPSIVEPYRMLQGQPCDALEFSQRLHIPLDLVIRVRDSNGVAFFAGESCLPDFARAPQGFYAPLPSSMVTICLLQTGKRGKWLDDVCGFLQTECKYRIFHGMQPHCPLRPWHHSGILMTTRAVPPSSDPEARPIQFLLLDPQKIHQTMESWLLLECSIIDRAVYDGRWIYYPMDCIQVWKSGQNMEVPATRLMHVPLHDLYISWIKALLHGLVLTQSQQRLLVDHKFDVISCPWEYYGLVFGEHPSGRETPEGQEWLCWFFGSWAPVVVEWETVVNVLITRFPILAKRLDPFLPCCPTNNTPLDSSSSLELVPCTPPSPSTE